MGKTFYQRLGEDSALNIMRAFRAKALQLHLDKVGNNEATVVAWHRMYKSYKCLSDPVQRRKYDRFLAAR